MWTEIVLAWSNPCYGYITLIKDKDLGVKYQKLFATFTLISNSVQWGSISRSKQAMLAFILAVHNDVAAHLVHT